MPDSCIARGCDQPLRGVLFMCNRHWFMTPPSLRRELCEAPEDQELARQLVEIAALREARLAELELPRTAGTLVKKLAGWANVARVFGAGYREVSKPGLVNNRPGRVLVDVAVDSLSVQATHADGRFVVACWTRREDEGKWKFDGAWRRWHGEERAGLVIELNSTQVNTYAAAEDVTGALEALAARALAKVESKEIAA